MDAPEIVFLDDEDAVVEVIDAEVVAPAAEPCGNCGSPIDVGDHFCVACGSSVDTTSTPAPPAPQRDAAMPEQKLFRCDGCGSEVATDPDQRSYVCPFCDSTYVVEFSRDVSQRQAPEFVIGFAVTSERAQELFRQWIGRSSWIRPKDLQVHAVAEKMRGVYLPFWSFSLLAESRWDASIGEYWYRTETYRTRENGKWVTKTRRVQETEWWPLAGRHHRFYSGYLVSGSRGLPQADAERIKPFNLPALKRYEPYFLAGWLCEEYTVERATALEVCQQHFYQRERQNIASFLPGDTSSNLDVETRFSHISSDLCLLPVYITTYRYRGKLYRFLVNGQTGNVAGDKPVAYGRVAILVILVLVAIAAVVGLFALVGGLIAAMGG